MESLAGQLQSKLGGLTQAQRDQNLALIFGQDAIRAANVLYTEGAEGIAEWTAKVDDAGYAAETAEARMDNLAGDIEKLGGAFDTALIKSGSAANEALRGLVQAATDLVDGFAGAPDGVQQSAVAIGAVTAAVGLASGAFLLGVPKVAAYKAALETLGDTAQRTSRVLGRALAATATAGGVAASAFVIHELAEAMTKDLVPSAAEVENAFKGSTTAIDRFRVASDTRFGDGFTSTQEAIKQLGSLNDALQASADSSASLGIQVQGYNGEILDTLKVMGKQYADLAASDLPAAQAGFRDLLKYTDGTAQSQWRLVNALGPNYRDALTRAASAQGVAADKTNLLKLAFGEAAPAAEDNSEALAELEGKAFTAEGAISDLAEAIRGFGSAELDTRAAARELEAAFDDLQTSIDANGASLDITEQAGRDNQAALDDLATSTLELAAATAIRRVIRRPRTPSSRPAASG